MLEETGQIKILRPRKCNGLMGFVTTCASEFFTPLFNLSLEL
jgi:hypothetical protein